MLCLPCFHGFGQSQLLHKISYSDTKGSYSFYIRIGKDEPVKLKDELMYYWFNEGAVRQNKGDFSGSLLQGTYERTSHEGQLLEKGNFNQGLKDGTWKSWNKYGDLVKIVNWEKGLKNGAYFSYDQPSDIEVRTTYKNGRIEGWYVQQQNDSIVSRVKYRKGKLVQRKDSKPTSN